MILQATTIPVIRRLQFVSVYLLVDLPNTLDTLILQAEQEAYALLAVLVDNVHAQLIVCDSVQCGCKEHSQKHFGSAVLKDHQLKACTSFYSPPEVLPLTESHLKRALKGCMEHTSWERMETPDVQHVAIALAEEASY